jgi:hypothetical protein
VNRTVVRRPGTFVYVSRSSAVTGAVATIDETEGVTSVVERAVAERLGLTWSFEAAWLTVEAQTSLEAIGITAALATALAEVNIPCNVLAGFHHDHLLVPIEQADAAIAALSR